MQTHQIEAFEAFEALLVCYLYVTSNDNPTQNQTKPRHAPAPSNRLQSIANEVFSLTGLQQLRLSNNLIEFIPVSDSQTLVSVIWRLNLSP
jgi:hypothetical protein